MIRDVGSGIGTAVIDTVGRAVGRVQERRALPVDVLESDDAFLAVFDAPGAHSTDVQVKFEDGDLLVRVDRFREFYDDYEMVFPGRGLALDGRVSLPDDVAVEPENAVATLKNSGALHVRIPKAGTREGEKSDGESDITGGTGDESPSNER